LRAAETIVRNVRVLATDQRTVSDDKDGKREVKTFQTITLEVTPRLAEKIAVAGEIGTLSLSLRSIADNNAELERAIASGEVKVPEGNDPKAEKKMLLQVASRPLDSDPTYVVGGDVSRFQRRTAPARPSSGNTAGQPGNAGPTAIPSNLTGVAAPVVVPTVRVTRGNTMTETPVGGK
jgi:pilus assembly protein CpaB